jgi:hypothetical protein
MTLKDRFVVAAVVAVAVAGAAACDSLGSSRSPTGASTLPGAESGATIVGSIAGMGGERTVAGASGSIRVTVVGTERAAAVSASGRFQITGVPAGDVVLEFSDGTTTSTAFVAGVSDGEQVELQIELGGPAASILRETRSALKLVLCHRTGAGRYQPISVSVNAEAAHRGHGDGEIGDPVPGSPTLRFDEDCQPALLLVAIVKSTNGEDADRAPGPSIPVGAPVNWTYLVTNVGPTLMLTSVGVTDDQLVSVSCPATSLAPGASMTCTASGVAILGPYVNVGTVTALAGATQVTASDVSRYLGIDPTATEGPKVQVCHRTGNGSFHLISIGAPAEPAHLAHGDGKPGGPVPGQAGSVFGPTCAITTASAPPAE